LASREITFKSSKSDVDDLFVYENIFVFVEYTITSEITKHLKKKYVLYQKILNDQKGFLIDCASKIDGFPKDAKYTGDQQFIKILYCVPSDIKQSLREELDGVYFFDLVVQNYFKKIASTIRHSARHELFAFFGLKYKDVGDGLLAPGGAPSDPYEGSVLPESSSSFPAGYKVVSFYIDPAALLPRAYVLRTEGWRDAGAVYQRLISKKKIDSIREYLRHEGRVFVNNIVVTLPSSTKLLDDNGDTVAPSKLTKTSPVWVQIPREFNSVGIVDGQHRVLSYHEGGKYEDRIAILRKKQNLLATGIIYPASAGDDAKARFEAKLFLEINSTQAGAKSDLKQAIALLLTPTSEISLAKRVVNYQRR
jgi:DGQHR domain-containing protein